ncbi:MAG: mandelate racemase/muconate lactonizing enzyme family protein, partial [Devosia sp.]
MSSTIKAINAYFLEIPRDTPYLGDLRPGETVNARGYFVRGGNRTVYPNSDRSVVVRIETSDGVVGWGETYGIVSPGAVLDIIRDLFSVFLVGRDPQDPVVIYEDLYDLMRVRGHDGGFYHDALAAVDIALWDICGKMAGLPVAKLLGGRRHQTIPAYVSGLPGATEAERLDMARGWQEKGFNSFKFATPAVDDPVREFQMLREGLGPKAEIAADLHWRHSDAEMLMLAQQVVQYRPWFLEAPCKPEDIAGLGTVSRRSPVPVAAGEEWRTVFDLTRRLTVPSPAMSSGLQGASRNHGRYCTTCWA